MIMISIGLLIFLLILVFVIRNALKGKGGEVGGWTIRGANHAIFAIARTTITEGVRSKVATVFIIVLLLTIPLTYAIATGDSTIKGRVQMFIYWSLGLSWFFLSLLTIFFSCRSLSREIEQRQIFGLVTKPVPRWQILAGKWVGVMTLCASLMAIAGVGIYAGSLTIVSDFRTKLRHQLETDGGITPDQAGLVVAALGEVRGPGAAGMQSPIITAMQEATGMSRTQIGDVLLRLPESTRVDLRRGDELRRQVLVARAAAKPDLDLDAIAASAQKKYDQLEKDGRLPVGLRRDQVLESLRAEVWGNISTVHPFGDVTWIMKGPKPDKRGDAIMSLRYKIESQTALPPLRFAQIGMRLEEDKIWCSWRIGNPESADVVFIPPPLQARTIQEIELPIECVESDGTIRVTLRNEDPRNVALSLDLMSDLEVMYVVGSFETNVFHACLAILISITCLASFGVCASTFLTFPVAALTLICLYIISASMGFIADSLAVTPDYYDPNVKQGLDFEFRRAMVTGLTWGLSIGEISPVSDLIDGRAIGWPRLFDSFWRFALVKGGLAMFIGVLAFRRRELAAVIV